MSDGLILGKLCGPRAALECRALGGAARRCCRPARPAHVRLESPLRAHIGRSGRPSLLAGASEAASSYAVAPTAGVPGRRCSTRLSSTAFVATMIELADISSADHCGP